MRHIGREHIGRDHAGRQIDLRIKQGQADGDGSELGNSDRQRVWSSFLWMGTRGSGAAGPVESVLPGDVYRTVPRYVPLALRRSVQPSKLSGARCFAHHYAVSRPETREEHRAVLRSGNRRRPRLQQRERPGELFEWRVAAGGLSHAEALPGFALTLA